jgi:hypothetical protein
MVTPLSHPGADSSLTMETVPPTIMTTPGGMILNLSRPPRPPQGNILWDLNFRLLVQFRDREGHLRVPSLHVEDSQKLGAWIRMQRVLERKGALCPERGRRLNEIGFIWNVYEARCDTMMTALAQFRQREGLSCKVSSTHTEHLDGGVELKLGAWLKNQRYLQGRGLLDAKIEKQLENLGVKRHCKLRQEIFEDNYVCQERSLWDFNLLLLLQFRDREGHSRVPIRHVEDGQKLGAWIRMLRVQKKKGILCPEQERRLNKIGFVWNIFEGKWDAMITALTRFKQREGLSCHLSDTHIEHLDGGVKLKLGAWLKLQRYQHGYGKLGAKREKQLESLGVKWRNKRQETAEESFDRNFDLLLAFKEREQHVRVPYKHQESATDNLGAWLGEQRSLYRHGLLELDRQKWFEVAGVTWESRITSS